MVASFARERTSELSAQLDTFAPVLLASPPSPTSPHSPTADDSESFEIVSSTPPSSSAHAERLTQVRTALSKLNLGKDGSDQSREAVLKVLREAYPGLDGQIVAEATAAGEGGREEGLEWVMLANLSVAAYGVVADELMKLATRVGEELEYWKEVETSSKASTYYFVQTLPGRGVHVGHLILARLRALTSNAGANLGHARSSSTYSVANIRAALPTPSVFVSSLFPHLSQELGTNVASSSVSILSTHKRRPNTFLSLSPLHLTKQEARLKRKSLESQRRDLARTIGYIAYFGSDIRFDPSPDSSAAAALSSSNTLSAVTDASASTVAFLRESLDILSTASDDDASSHPGKALSQDLSTLQSSPHSLAKALHALLCETLPRRTNQIQLSLNRLSRPSPLVRAWPVLVVGPLAAVVAARVIYNSKDKIGEWWKDAKETIRGFLVGWVKDPIVKILDTVRHGEDGTLAIMGRESLKSDLDSLERMVADFGRDTGHYTDEEVAKIAARVREGDITPVLRVWEANIKTPLRSAVSGDLVRALLIQIQKVKVDVALAMDGIEKMLRSQQLTFAAVGIAPSLIVLLLAANWSRSAYGALIRGGGRSSKAMRLRARSTIRRIDRLLTTVSSHPPSSDPNEEAETPHEETLGFLLLETQTLRQYASKALFPINSVVQRGEFLEDVRDLEGTLDTGAKHRVVDRMWRSWADPLGWNRL